MEPETTTLEEATQRLRRMVPEHHMARPPSLEERLGEKYFQLLSDLKNYKHVKDCSALITY